MEAGDVSRRQNLQHSSGNHGHVRQSAEGEERVDEPDASLHGSADEYISDDSQLRSDVRTLMVIYSVTGPRRIFMSTCGLCALFSIGSDERRDGVQFSFTTALEMVVFNYC